MSFLGQRNIALYHSKSLFSEVCDKQSLSSRHTASKQMCMNIDTTAWRHSHVDATLRPHVPTGLIQSYLVHDVICPKANSGQFNVLTFIYSWLPLKVYRYQQDGTYSCIVKINKQKKKQHIILNFFTKRLFSTTNIKYHSKKLRTQPSCCHQWRYNIVSLKHTYGRLTCKITHSNTNALHFLSSNFWCTSQIEKYCKESLQTM